MIKRQYKHSHIGLALWLLAVAVALVVVNTAAQVNTAYAGQWIEVSCENPDHSAAPSQDWGSFAGGGGYGSTNSTSCSPGNPMFAMLSTDAAVATESNETLQFTPPSGSSLTGGSIDAGLYADGHGYEASGTAVLYTPNYAYDGSDVYFQCDWGLTPCSGSSNDFAGAITLPEGRGGSLYLSAGCGGAKGAICNEGGSNGAWSLVRVWWANLLLSNNATPAASGFGGTLLQAGARGQRELTLTASDPTGPGVYAVTVQVDAKTLYAATPDDNGGHCVPVGSSGGVLMFDYAQPCRASEALDLPIETAALQDGQHTLKVSVKDAAGNSAVVYDATITTDNAPQQSSAPMLTEPRQLVVGSVLSAQPGGWSAPAGAGKITYAYQWQDCDQHGAGCQTIPGAQSASYTLAPSDEGHTIRVAVTASDSDGQNSATSASSSPVQPAQSSLGTAPGPGASSPETTQKTTPTPAPSSPADTSTPTAPSGLAGGITGAGSLGPANGLAASRAAVLRLAARALTRTFAQRAFVLRGQLLDTAGQPISGARLEVLQRPQGSTSSRVIAHATTRGDGSFTVHVPKGPSRLVQVAYRAFALEAGYAAKASVKEAVKASAHLRITPTSTTPSGMIVLTGAVQGPVPRAGALVDLLVFYHGRWVPIPSASKDATVRTDSAGHFTVAYRFQGGTGRFPFRAEMPAGQAGFPYARGYSNKVDVTT